MNYFCCLLSSIRYGSWCVGFILSLAVSILSRFFVVFFPPFFLSFLRRILAMSSCCCCDFWDCLGGVCNLLSSVPFRCWIFLLRNFFWFCASITSLRFFLFCFCLVFVFVFSPSLILFGSWQAASALLVCASLTSLLFFFFFSFSFFLLLFSDPGKHWLFFATSQFLSFFSYARCCLEHQTSSPSWSVTSLAGDSSLLQPSIIVDSYPQLSSSSSSVLRSLSNAAAAHLFVHSYPHQRSSAWIQYLVPILSFFSQCLFLLCDDDSTSTRVVIHEFSFQ